MNKEKSSIELLQAIDKYIKEQQTQNEKLLKQNELMKFYFKRLIDIVNKQIENLHSSLYYPTDFLNMQDWRIIKKILNECLEKVSNIK